MKDNNELKGWEFIGNNGHFIMTYPDQINYLYFPLVNESGMMSSITPELQGDIKTGQNTFILSPVSSEDLHNSRNGRNFWCHIKGKGVWSVSGNSAFQRSLKFSENNEELVKLEAGFLWHKITRKNTRIGIQAEITNFVPVNGNQVELMEIKLTNIGTEDLTITPTTAIPLFCRSADNFRDHRHVTSLLHRIHTTKYGIFVKPTLSFDERGHQKNEVSYAVLGSDENENPPIGFFPIVEDFIGNGGSFDWPEAIISNSQKYISSGNHFEGYEAIGALRFDTITLTKGSAASYRIVLLVNHSLDKYKGDSYLSKKNFNRSFQDTKFYWNEKLDRLKFYTGNKSFNLWMKWVTIQPVLRRIFGCSFLPHHDYGRGGRGWRDLWQDCLALLLMEPKNVHDILYNNFAGVRFDGSNATIIGMRPGEFIADRNDIPRVWMDHGSWPFLTTKLYIDQSGDLDFIMREQVYFKDKHIDRCKAHDKNWSSKQGTNLLTEEGHIYRGTIIEHILVQHLTSFFNVGENNNILLEGADWNDGLDMAREKGESVAFTALYAYNLIELAKLLQNIKARKNLESIKLAEEIKVLIDTVNDPIDYSSWQSKRNLLEYYFKNCEHRISGKKITITLDDLISDLLKKGNWLIEYIRNHEWITNNKGYSWFNGYYDNNGSRLEGDFPKGVRMTLTGQVFTLMGDIATDKQMYEIINSVKKYLWDENVGGVRLNTNFKEVLLTMGRCFGFAYGHKENGAMFSHMAVMYAYALYKRGIAKEGFKVLDSIYHHCIDFNKCRIYPGIPEYINQRGKGMYHYLTGSASWLLLTILTRTFGVRGELGDLLIKPMLLASQFDEFGKTRVNTLFANRRILVTFSNEKRKEYGEYRINKVRINDSEVSFTKYESGVLIPRRFIEELDQTIGHNIFVELN